MRIALRLKSMRQRIDSPRQDHRRPRLLRKIEIRGQVAELPRVFADKRSRIRTPIRLRIDARAAQIPILVVSATYEVEEAAERLGATACLRKPFELDALIATVARLVGRLAPAELEATRAAGSGAEVALDA